MDVDEAGVVVEGVPIDQVGGLLGGQDEDGAGLGVGVVGAGMAAHGEGGGVGDGGGAVDGVGAPVLHAGAVDGLAVVGEGQPGEGLVVGDGGALDEGQGVGLIVELDGEDGSGGRPGEGLAGVCVSAGTDAGSCKDAQAHDPDRL